MPEDAVLAVVTVLTLISSLLFLLVVVSRIRFAEALHGFDRLVREVRALVEREAREISRAEVAGLGLDDPSLSLRLETLRDARVEATEGARSTAELVSPVMTYMALVRNVGVVSFLTVLVFSAALLSQRLAIVFAVLVLVSALYGRGETWLRRRSLKGVLEKMRGSFRRRT